MIWLRHQHALIPISLCLSPLQLLGLLAVCQTRLVHSWSSYTACLLCLEGFSPRYIHGSLPHLFQVFTQMSSSQWGLP